MVWLESATARISRVCTGAPVERGNDNFSVAEGNGELLARIALEFRGDWVELNPDDPFRCARTSIPKNLTARANANPFAGITAAPLSVNDHPIGQNDQAKCNEFLKAIALVPFRGGDEMSRLV